MPDGQRRLAAIVAADVAGYSRLMGADEEGTIAALRAHRSEVIEPKLAQHHGRVANTAGDSLLIEFPSAVDALRCVIEVQREITARNADIVEDRRILFRIGINVGDVVAEGDDLLGDGVNVAARLEALAEPGGICISRTARDQVRDRMDIKLEDLGEVEVKNIARPVRVFKVVGEVRKVAEPTRPNTSRFKYAAAVIVLALVAGGYWWQQRPDFQPADPDKMALALPDKPSVAVLPFINISSDKEQDYFADGMVEDLITDLSKVSGLFVIARNSTFTYKNKAVKVQQVAEDLGVRYVVEGSVRRVGDTVRINVQVIDALSGRHVWAERYDRAMADIFDLQDEITGKVVTALTVKLVPGEAKPARGTDNPAAYDAVLLGWNYLHVARNNPKNYVLAREQFENALRLDPNYNRAHLSLAAVWWWSALTGQYFRLDVDYEKGVALAKSHLKTAMKMPTALGHRIRSEMYRYEEKQLDLAIAEARRAISLDANNSEGYRALAAAQIHSGQQELAITNLDIADRLDPENLRSNWGPRGRANLLLGNYAEAVRYLELSVAAQPNFRRTYRWLIAAFGHLDKKAEAKASIEKLNQLRAADDFSEFTLVSAISVGLKRAKDRETFLQGLEKAGLAAGGDVKATQQALDNIVSWNEQGRYSVQGAKFVNAKETKALLDRGVVVFNMLPIRHWKVGHIKGSLHGETVIGNFTAANLGKFVKKNQPVVFYCSGFT